MEAAKSSETLVSYHITTSCHSLEDYDMKVNAVDMVQLPGPALSRLQPLDVFFLTPECYYDKSVEKGMRSNTEMPESHYQSVIVMVR